MTNTDFPFMNLVENNYNLLYELNLNPGEFISNSTSFTEIPGIFSIICPSQITPIKNEEVFISKKKRKPHDKFDKDNIKRKIQVYYIKFLVKFVNKIILEIFKKYNSNNIDINDKKKIENYQFRALSYDFSKKIDSFSFNQNKEKSIKEILIENTSPKFKNFNNKNIYNNIIKINEKINSILNKPYLQFFHIFYQKENFVFLKENGFDLVLYLNDIERFQEFLDSQKNQTKNFDVYNKRIEDCVKDDYIISSNYPFFYTKTK